MKEGELVGDLLTAKEDEGIFAIHYDANGPWDKPKIQVNPLSLLTPGIIRNIFNNLLNGPAHVNDALKILEKIRQGD